MKHYLTEMTFKKNNENMIYAVRVPAKNEKEACKIGENFLKKALGQKSIYTKASKCF